MPPPELPGYYYDQEKKKYFKIIKGGIPESNQETKYHHNSVQANKRRDKYASQIQKVIPKSKQASDAKITLAKRLDLVHSPAFRLQYRPYALTDLKIGNNINHYIHSSSFIYNENFVVNSYTNHKKILRLHELYNIDGEAIKIYQIMNPRSTEYFQMGIQKNNGGIVNVIDNTIQRFCQGVHSIYPDSYVLFDESSISSTKYQDGFLILTTYTIGTQNFFSIRKVTVNGDVEDYTIRLLAFLRQNCHTKQTLTILRPFVDLPFVNFPKSYIDHDENKLIDNWHMNNPRRMEIRQDFTTIYPNISHSYKFDDDTYTSSVKLSYIDSEQLIIITKIGTIIRITFDKLLNFENMYLKKFKSIMNFSIDEKYIYIYSSNWIQILTKNLITLIQLPIPLSKYVYYLTSWKFVLITKDWIYQISYLGDIYQEFDKKHFEIVKICQYFNDNDPKQRRLMFDSNLIIHETLNRFKLINFNQMENNIATIKVKLPFDVNNFKLNTIKKISSFPIVLKLNYIDEMKKKSIFFDLKV